MRVAVLLGVSALVLAGCGPAIPARPARAAPAVAVPTGTAAAAAPGSVSGLSARRLIAQFGSPSLDQQEGRGRKLQFLGPSCVLDAYLYPPGQGNGEAVVRHVDTRQRTGAPVSEGACVAALTKRPPGH